MSKRTVVWLQQHHGVVSTGVIASTVLLLNAGLVAAQADTTPVSTSETSHSNTTDSTDMSMTVSLPDGVQEKTATSKESEEKLPVSAQLETESHQDSSKYQKSAVKDRTSISKQTNVKKALPLVPATRGASVNVNVPMLNDPNDKPATSTTPVEPEPQKPQVDLKNINSWMPDTNLQEIVLLNLQQTGVNVRKPADITLGMVQQLKRVEESFKNADEQDNQNYYNAVTKVTNLNGLEYAKNLTSLSINAESAHSTVKNIVYVDGQLTDISALANNDSITFLDLANNNISDVSSLKKLAQADFNRGGGNISLNNNHINNAGALIFPYKEYSLFLVSVLDQTFWQSPITLSPNATNYITDSPIYTTLISDSENGNSGNSSLSHTNDIDPTKFGLPKPTGILGKPSTSDNPDDFTVEYPTGKVLGLDTPKLTWSKFGTDPKKGIGLMVSKFDNDNADVHFYWEGTIVTPYTLNDRAKNAVVHFQVGVDNNQSPEYYGGNFVKPDITIDNDSKNEILNKSDEYDVLNNSAVQKNIADLKAQGLTYIGSNLDGGKTKVELSEAVSNITLYFGFTQKIYFINQDSKLEIGHKSVEIPAVFNKSWEQTIPTIPGYTFDHFDQTTSKNHPIFLTTTNNISKLSGKMGESNPDIHIYFKKQASVSQMINFVDEAGKPLKNVSPITITGAPKTSQTVNLPPVNGYEVQKTTAGTIKDGQLTVTLAVGAKPITVTYHKLTTPVTPTTPKPTLPGGSGSTVEPTTPEQPAPTPIPVGVVPTTPETPQPSKPALATNAGEAATAPNTPVEQPTTQPTHQSAGKGDGFVKRQPQKVTRTGQAAQLETTASARRLPQTAEQRQPRYQLFGLGLLGGLLGLASWRRKRL